MKYAAIIVDNRDAIRDKAIEEHRPFIPKDWEIIGCTNSGIETAAGYNFLLTSPSFWYQFLEYDRVLIFQHDSQLLRHGIEEFLKFDFVGARIKEIFGCMNGGLSIRNPELMHKVCIEHPYMGMQRHGNEDIYFVNTLMREYEWNSPGWTERMLFSVETCFGLGSLGIHAIDKYLTPDQCNQIRCQYK